MNAVNEASPLFCALGSEDTVLTDDEIRRTVCSFLDAVGTREDVLILPPDFTRLHSAAGKITRFICEHYNFTEASNASSEEGGAESSEGIGRQESANGKLVKPVCKKSRKDGHQPVCSDVKIQILPALGTHAPMTEEQIKSMFGEGLAMKQPSPFLVHDWRKDVVTIGHAPAEMVSEATNGMVQRPWPAQLNKLVWAKRQYDPEKHPHKSLVLSVGQVVPHEVMGMANFNKNLFVGTGGVDAINLSHFIGAIYGMENMMGRANNPLRSILNYASEKYLQHELDLWYILTVMGTNTKTGNVEMRGLYIGNDIQCYNLACELSLKVNFTLLERPPEKIVVYLDGGEFHSTWLGCKAIYRTRMAIADGGEIIVLAPGVKSFGEDEQIDKLIRAFGYIGTPAIMKTMKENEELQKNLSAVAHMIHGSTEGRFTVTFCPGHLTRDEVEGVGFQYNDLAEMMKLYNTATLRDGWNVRKCEGGSDEEFFYVSNPALGLWAVPSRFEGSHVGNKNSTGDAGDMTSSSSADQVAIQQSGGVGGWKR